MNAFPTADPNEADLVDIIGTRVLSGVQMVWISRLSTHPLPLVSSGFVTVAGQGPSDSNGAGKSSFIAAISLLCGDEQWRWGGGAKAAAELLFTAEVAAQEQHRNADHGFVVGVFTDPTAASFHELTDSAITVWLRINRSRPYIDLRWTEGLRLACGASESERTASVDQIWASLKRRGTTGDLHANAFNQTMYGGYVRSVSFLSTSVRASHTPNLLAQPLNELAPERIFDAVAALTGLDRELEHEREYRTLEHARRDRQAEVLAKIEAWEVEARRVEDAIAERQQARADLERTRHLWKGQCARAVVDGADRIEALQAYVKELEADHKQLGERREETNERLEGIADDEAFDRRFREAKQRKEDADTQKSTLRVKQRTLIERIEQHQGECRTLGEQARTSDGRSVTEAASELAAARQTLEDARVAQRLETERERAAAKALEAAEQGRSHGAGALNRLEAAGIEAVALLEAAHLSATEREEWEPRLAPYAEAVVVTDTDLDRALDAIAELPGAILIAADPANTDSPGSGLPAHVEPQFPLTEFLTALQTRGEGGGHFTDAPARARVVGPFPDPITGRTARIRQAQQALEAAVDRRKEAESKTTAAEGGVRLAQARLDGAEAAERKTGLEARIKEARDEHEDLQAQIERESPRWQEAEEEFGTVLGLKGHRTAETTRLERELEAIDNSLLSNGEQRVKLLDEQQAIDLDRLLEAFGEREAADARRYLMALTDEAERAWSIDEWQDTTLEWLEKALRRCFPEDTAPASVPQQILNAWKPHDPRITRRSLAAAATGDLIQALNAYLRGLERQDEFETNRIEQERTEHSRNLAAAQDGFTEASNAAEAHRASVAAGITATLKEVAKHFNDLDRSYSGYGATLDFTEPEPPTEPDKPWRWTLTPKWSRAEGQRPAGYKLKGNTAQVEEKAIKLVCAAALAGGSERPLMLILDELGRNLGKQHRRDAVALFESIGNDHNITVIGALQDDMERYAIEASGLFIKLRRSTDTQPYNDPPAIVGHEAQADRVRLLQSWLETGHLGAGRPAEADRPR